MPLNFEHLPPEAPIKGGKPILSALACLASLDERQIEAVREVFEPYDERQQQFMLVRHRYTSDNMACAALDIPIRTMRWWRANLPDFNEDVSLVAEKLSDFEMRRLHLRFERLARDATNEAAILINTPWDDLTDRAAQVKGRLISELWHGVGLVKKAAGISVNVNTGQQVIGMEDVVQSLREAQSRGIIDASGRVVEALPIPADSQVVGEEDQDDEPDP